MNFTPEFKSKEVSRNVRDFVKGHNDYFVQLIKYMAPYILILTVLSTAASYFGAQVFAQEMAEKFQDMRDMGDADFAPFMMSMMFGALFNFWGLLGVILSFASAYLYACIGISWHRLVLLGAENYKPVNILKPEKNDIEFFGLLIVFNLIPLIAFIPAIVSVSVLAIFLMSVCFCAIFYYLYRISFLFPAKAVNVKLNMKTSYTLTEGTFWAFNMSLLRATIRVVVVVIIYSIIVQILTTLVTPVHDNVFLDFAELLQPTFATHILPSIINLPILLYFQPLLTVLGVTVLSNYYQYALQNSTESRDTRA